MPRTVIIGTEEFQIPLEGENPSYGEELTDFFVAVADALQNVQAPNDILRSTAPINNNVSSPSSIVGFAFDTTEVRTINCEYLVQRTTDVPSNNLVESGFIEGNYDGTEWHISIERQGDAGVSFSITSGGQVQYTSTNVTGSNYSGSIIFKARVFNENA